MINAHDLELAVGVAKALLVDCDNFPAGVIDDARLHLARVRRVYITYGNIAEKICGINT